MKSSLKESYNLTLKLCKSIGNINFVGLYRPWNEDWDWLYLFELTKFEKWQEINDHFCEEFQVYGDNPGRFLTRMYEDARQWLTDDIGQLPQGMIRGRKIYHTQYYLNRNYQENIMKEFYNTQVDICERLKGIDFLGLFAPWNDHWNWAPMWMMDSLKDQLEMRAEFGKRFGFPEEIQNSLIRFYERYEPSS